MKKLCLFAWLFISINITAQTDYSQRWEDFYSYNNVKDFEKVGNSIFAITDNAVFSYDLSSNTSQKMSSVSGFSGETTSAIHYSESSNILVIGYENGLLEILDVDGNITIAADIVNFDQSGEKEITAIYEHNQKLYLATPFAIIVYDIAALEFGDTYFIGSGSSSLKINDLTIYADQIYAATENGIYSADINNKSLIDFNNWTRLVQGNFNQVAVFQDKIYTSSNTDLYELQAANLLPVKNYSTAIQSLQSSANALSVGLLKEAFFYAANLTELANVKPNTTFNFSLNTATFVDNVVFLGTKEYGLLTSELSSLNSFKEIHPTGPISNQVFAIEAHQNNFWVVYGGYNTAYVPLGLLKGYSHYNGNEWVNTTPNSLNPIYDLVNITIDTKHENRVFISSFADTNSGNYFSGGGLLEVIDDTQANFYSSQNSPLEDLFPSNPNRITTRISGSAFDDQGNLWVADALGSQKLKKLLPDGSWLSFDLSSLQSNSAQETNKVVIDRSSNVWIGTRRNGVYVFNENDQKKKALTTEITKGSLPHPNVRALAVDRNNKVWIGTQSGLVVFSDVNSLFDANVYDASPIIILDDGIPKKLLGDQTVNTIAVDGADNKWFGTENGGVVYTNPSGLTTLAAFNKDNSPLPSNKILKISVDTSNGKVYFATDKGVVAYNSEVATFGEVLTEVYAYPNPALKQHESITIDGRNGQHLPKGANVKILDVSGNLVYETNVIEGQEVQGGKVVWNKQNLAGVKVASGVYIVLIINEDGSETSSTKIAVIN
ncbi:ABC transporter substrate-binding protein [Polaribacter pacificus]|uniref:ABC transporter substrate-binding protein n=1 Tax=Polaribacter pacificus TaxID=1775173 RepID=A0A917HX54_9FLAO|nr:two-component regulator propeller domain-containing protein [Polaribacter pacificus]GGG93456.1 ABC transporter substrate-binding protein [Polaribacter pacificus]